MLFLKPNSFLMIHNSWVMTVGNAERIRKTADLLDKKIYAVSKSAYLDKANDQVQFKADVRCRKIRLWLNKLILWLVII